MILPHAPGSEDQLTDDQWSEGMRLARNELLAACDWTQTEDAPIHKAAWADYRQQLRDFPATWTPGPVCDFPEPPDA